MIQTMHVVCLVCGRSCEQSFETDYVPEAGEDDARKDKSTQTTCSRCACRENKTDAFILAAMAHEIDKKVTWRGAAEPPLTLTESERYTRLWQMAREEVNERRAGEIGERGDSNSRK